jgi:omega-6 fatty acid desaturase (delta-12 desaturase)
LTACGDPASANERETTVARRIAGLYSDPSDWRRSVLQLAVSASLFILLLGFMIAGAQRQEYWLVALLALPAGGLLVRLFIIQHDCGHGSFFRSRVANDILGRCLSVFTLTPYDHWKRSHALHHATSGNLDRRGLGDVATLTVREYQALSPFRRLGYRLYRNPFIMIALGAPINFIFLQRAPLGRAARNRAARRSIISLDLALVGGYGAAMAMLGVMPVLAAYAPVMIIASWIGGWLFYVQHQFDGVYWKRDQDWDFQEAALQGSSYFKLPAILQWFTGNIGLHHVHHLCSRLPNYRLQACMDAFPELRSEARRVTLRESFNCWRLALWDEDSARLVGFRESGQPTLTAVRR